MSKIQRLSLKDQIKDILINQINSGELKPGDKLRELTIAKEFGTSQAPVREAIRCLESLGYVEHKTNTGTTVKTHSIDEIKEAFQIREALEVYSLSSSFNNLQNRSNDLKNINQNIGKAVKNLNSVFELVEKFHFLIIESNSNLLMMNIWKSLEIQCKLSSEFINSKEALNEISDLHSDLVKSINKNDATESSIKIINFYDLLRNLVNME